MANHPAPPLSVNESDDGPPVARAVRARRLANRLTMSETTVWRIWQTVGLKPHRTATFKFSTDPELVAKVRDVVGLYLAPP